MTSPRPVVEPRSGLVWSGADARVSRDLGRFAPKPDSRLVARGRDPAGLFLAHCCRAGIPVTRSLADMPHTPAAHVVSE